MSRLEPWNAEAARELLDLLPPTHQDYLHVKYACRHADEKGFLLVDYYFARGLSFGRVYSGAPQTRERGAYRRVGKTTT